MNRRWPLLIALALATLAAAPLLSNPGFLNTRAGGDSPFLLFRLHQLHTALSEGVFPVRWMPDAAYGLGYPFFNYYAALAFYLAAAFKGLGFAYVASLKLAHLAGFLLAGGAMYAWMRRHTRSHWGALLASAAYTFAPFHMVNVYVRGDSLAEFFAFVWYPLTLLAVDRLLERRSGPRAAGLALAYAGLLLTHNISAFIFSPFLLLYLLLMGARRAAPLRGYAAGALALALGAVLAAWFWLPALGELHLAQLAPSTTGYFHYSNHFRSGDLIQASLAFDYGIRPDAPLTPFSFGVVQSALAAAGAAALLWRRVARREAEPPAAFGAALLLSLVLAAFLITPASRALWDSLPLLAVVQFPWRFLSVAALFAAGLSGYAADAFAGGLDRPAGARAALPAAVALALGGACAVSALAGLPLDFISLTDHDVTPERLQLYEYFSGNIGATIRYEWLPNTVNPRPYTGPDLIGLEPRAKPLSGAATGARLERGAAAQRWRITVTSDTATIALPLHYWPGWRAAADGLPVELSAAPGLGWAQMTLPRGAHTVALWLDRTPVRAAGEWLSALAVVVVLVLLRRAFRSLPAAVRRRRRWILAGAAALGVVWVWLRLAPGGASASGPLTMDFLRQAYPYHAPEGVAFADGTTLRDYEPEPGAPCPAFTVRAQWADAPAPPEGLASEVELTLPAANVAGVPVALGGGEAALVEGDAAESMTVAPPCPLSPGVYLPTLRVVAQGESIPALTAAGEPRGALTLAPLVQTARLQPGASDTPAAEVMPGLQLLDAALQPGDAPYVLLRWRADAELARNYHIGLRLRDVAGNLWAEQDAPMGLFGAYPPALWTPGELVRDFYALQIPPAMPPGGDYRLQISVYDAATGAVAGEVVVGDLRWAGYAPSDDAPRRYHLTDRLSLSEIIAPDAATLGQGFALTARWIAEQEPAADYQARWALRDAAGVEAWSVVTPLAPGSPATGWPRGALVEGRLHIDPPAALPPGDYTLMLTLLGPDGAPAHDPAPVQSVALEAAPVPTGEPERLAQRVDVDFGGVVRLWGYDAAQDADALTLTLTWGALAETGTDYTFFVHLFDPETEAIPAQVDAMPHGYTHPTSTWTPGEIVTDVVTLALGSVPPGAYRVAVGWYVGDDRLPAYDASGARLDHDRAILPLTVRVPGEGR